MAVHGTCTSTGTSMQPVSVAAQAVAARAAAAQVAAAQAAAAQAVAHDTAVDGVFPPGGSSCSTA